MSINDRTRHASEQVQFEEHTLIGYNYRMTDIQAAVGREQLKRMPDVVARRRDIAGKYHEALSEVDGVVPPHEPDWARTNYQTYLIRIPDTADQRSLMQALLDRGVASRRGIMNSHREAPYRSDIALPVSEWGQDRHIAIPLYPAMTLDDADYVVDQIAEAVHLAGLTTNTE